MLIRSKLLLIVSFLFLAFCIPCVRAQSQTFTPQVVTVGSSAQWGVFAEAAYQLAKAGGAVPRHYTSTRGAAILRDLRNNGALNNPGNLWVVWNDSGKYWAYLSIDSAVGVRAFMAAPRSIVILSPTAPILGDNALTVWDDGSIDTELPTAISTALSNGTALTAANTDVRPEDALFATTRTLTTLGYAFGSNPPASFIGNPIESAFNPTVDIAVPNSFALSGYDPLTGDVITPYVTIPVGAAPIAFIVNRTNASGLGYINPTTGAYGIQDLKVTATHNAGRLFSGEQCDTNIFNSPGNTVPSSDAAVFPVLLEPTSGIMATAEYTDFNIYDGGSTPDGNTQELGISPANSFGNPLHQVCAPGLGMRYRAVGNRDAVNAISNAVVGIQPYPLPTADQIGYVFFSYEVTASIANNTKYNYLTLDGVDGISNPSSASTHELPLCGTSIITNCQAQVVAASFNSFPNLRSGSYRSWSIYRMISDSANVDNVQTLIAQADSVADFSLPDFVPFSPQCAVTATGPADPGLAVYREHYMQSGISPNDGPLQAPVTCTLPRPHTMSFGSLGGEDPVGANNEAGGDVGGAIVLSNTTVPGPTARRQ